METLTIIKPLFQPNTRLIVHHAVGIAPDTIEADGKRYKVLDHFTFLKDDPHPGGLYLLATGKRYEDLNINVRFYIVEEI